MVAIPENLAVQDAVANEPMAHTDPFLEQARSLVLDHPAPSVTPVVLPLSRVNFRPAVAGGAGRIATGVKRLDELLGGGYPAGSAIILYGPPFCGKQQLQHQNFTQAALQGIPCTLILHAISAGAMSERLKLMDPAFAQAESAGTVSYIDVYSHFLGEPEDHPNTTYVKDPTDFPSILAAFDQHQERQLKGQSAPHVVGIESMSTILVDSGPNRTFAFLRTILGRTIHRGGVALLCLEADMHAEPDVQMAKHLSSGILELRKKGETRCLRVEGLETVFPRAGWVEYEFSMTGFKLTGGFSARTIR